MPTPADKPSADPPPTRPPSRYKEARIWTSTTALDGCKRVVDLLDRADRWSQHSLGRTVEELVSRYGDRLVLDTVAEVRQRIGERGEAVKEMEEWARAVLGEREEWKS